MIPPETVVEARNHGNRNPINGRKSIFTTICQLGLVSGAPLIGPVTQVTVGVEADASEGAFVVK